MYTWPLAATLRHPQQEWLTRHKIYKLLMGFDWFVVYYRVFDGEFFVQRLRCFWKLTPNKDIVHGCFVTLQQLERVTLWNCRFCTKRLITILHFVEKRHCIHIVSESLKPPNTDIQLQ